MKKNAMNIAIKSATAVILIGGTVFAPAAAANAAPSDGNAKATVSAAAGKRACTIWDLIAYSITMTPGPLRGCR